MICNTIGLTSDSFETLYVRGGEEVPEVYGSINYAQPVFYSLKTLTGATSYSFMGYSEPLKSYEISGNMVQNGTPTPTSTIYPQECGVRSVNIMPSSISQAVTNNGVTITCDGLGRYEVSGRAEPGASVITLELMSEFTIPVSVGKGGNGCMLLWNNVSMQQQAVTVHFMYKGSDIDSWSLHETNRQHNTYVGMGGKKCDAIRIVVSNGWRVSFTFSPEFVDTGTYPQEFEPYGRYKIPLNLNGTNQNIYLSEPLRKIESYADSISSDGTVTRRIKKLVLTGEEEWVKPNTTRNIYRTTVLDYLREMINIPICTHYKGIPPVSGTSDINNNFETAFLISDTGNNYYYIRDDRFPSPADFSSYLQQQYAAGTPVTVWYMLAEPTTEQVTAPTITPATGSNTLAIGTTLQPSSVSITGHVKPSS